MNYRIRRRTVALVSSVFLIGIISGALAFPVTVRNISPISSSDVKVRPAHLEVVDVDWVIDPSSSTVEGVILQVVNTDAQLHTFQVVVQVSCLSSGFIMPGFVFKQKPFICAGGSFITPLLPPGNATTVPVDLDVAIEPERTQIEDLSFIVTEDPIAPPPPTGQLSNLMFPICDPPPTVNALTTCLGSAPGIVSIEIKNNGPVAAGPFDVVFSGELAATLSSPGLAPGASTFASVTYTTLCTFNPDCNFDVTIDPPNAVAESDESDNFIRAIILG